ncbi:MAG: hypothetical protein GY715_05550 [Planctomycetes bacterium]|nr:hypothetical protein [Planctomycetota bacterium]
MHRTTTLIAVTLTTAATLASPAGAGNATLTIGSAGAEPGQTVTVPVTLSTDDLVGAFDFAVDASGLVIAGVDYNGLLFSNGWDGWDTTPAADAHVTAACIFPQDQIVGSMIGLLDLQITVPLDALPSSEITVDLASAQVSDYSFIPYDLTINAGAILITSATCAEDVDGSGTVDFGDMLTIIGQWGACGGTCPADVNGDGVVSWSDVVMVIGQWGTCP